MIYITNTPTEVIPDREYLQSVNICFGLPAYGGMMTEACFTSFIKWAAIANSLGINWNTYTLANESLITRGRNTIVKYFEESEQYTHLMFVDADIGWEPGHLIRLLQHKKPLIGGCYPLKSLPLEAVANPVEGGYIDSEIMEVSRTGTGFLLIERQVIEKMKEHEKVVEFTSDQGINISKRIHTWFDVEVRDDTYLSEDWFFCENWRDLGGQVFLDRKFILNHMGTITFGPTTNSAVLERARLLFQSEEN